MGYYMDELGLIPPPEPQCACGHGVTLHHVVRPDPDSPATVVCGVCECRTFAPPSLTPTPESEQP